MALRQVGVVDPPPPPVSRHAVRNGIRSHTLEWGSPDAPTAVLVHGVGQTAHSWNVVAGALAAQGWHVVVPDLRGHGDSEWSAGMFYSLEDHADDLEALCAEVRPTLICGFSLGGMAVMYRAHAVPSVEAVVVVDTSPAVLERDDTVAPDDSRTRLTGFLGQGAVLDGVEDFVELAVSFNPRRDRDLLRITLPQSLRQLADGRWAWKYDSRPFEGAPGSSTSMPTAESLWSAVARLRAPVLVVKGGDSPLLTAAQADVLVDAVDGQLVVIPEAGHTCHSDRPDAFLAALFAFLELQLGARCPPG